MSTSVQCCHDSTTIDVRFLTEFIRSAQNHRALKFVVTIVNNCISIQDTEEECENAWRKRCLNGIGWHFWKKQQETNLMEDFNWFVSLIGVVNGWHCNSVHRYFYVDLHARCGHFGNDIYLVKNLFNCNYNCNSNWNWNWNWNWNRNYVKMMLE